MSFKYTQEDTRLILELYDAGESPYSISAKVGIPKTTIQEILKRNSIKTRSLKEASGGLTEAQIDNIVKLYTEDAMSSIKISKLVHKSPGTIINALHKRGINTERASRKKYKYSNQIRDQMVELYATLSVKEISKQINVPEAVIWGELRRRNIPKRPARGRGVFHARQQDAKDIVEKYQRGESKSWLATKYECSPDAIAKVLRDASVPIRSQERAIGIFWTDKIGREFHMRSTWEVKRAMQLDLENIRWDYEKEKFELKDGRTYTPDFWIYDVSGNLTQIEDVKGWARPESLSKIETFKLEYPQLPFRLLDEKALFDLGVFRLDLPESCVPTTAGRVSNEKRKIILDLYAQGHSQVEIEAILGITADTIHKILKEANITIRTIAESRLRKVSKETRDKMIMLYQQGFSAKSISNQLFVSRDQVYNELRRRGISRRSNREKGRLDRFKV